MLFVGILPNAITIGKSNDSSARTKFRPSTLKSIRQRYTSLTIMRLIMTKLWLSFSLPLSSFLVIAVVTSSLCADNQMPIYLAWLVLLLGHQLIRGRPPACRSVSSIFLSRICGTYVNVCKFGFGFSLKRLLV